MTEPNAELAYKVLDHIDAHPEQWNQGDWLGKTSCGTAGCFAGWAVVLAGLDLLFDEPDPEFPDYSPALFVIGADGQRDIPSAARDVLGLKESGFLFSPVNTRKGLGIIVAELFGPRPSQE
jgi:hypothetical protein